LRPHDRRAHAASILNVDVIRGHRPSIRDKFYILNMVAVDSCETLVFICHTTRRHIPKYHNLDTVMRWPDLARTMRLIWHRGSETQMRTDRYEVVGWVQFP
jgi:hypothetical protein